MNLINSLFFAFHHIRAYQKKLSLREWLEVRKINRLIKEGQRIDSNPENHTISHKGKTTTIIWDGKRELKR